MQGNPVILSLEVRVMYKFILDDAWKSWAEYNLSKNASKKELFTILLNHGYEFDVIKNLLEYQPTEDYLLERREVQGRMMAKEQTSVYAVPYKRLADNPLAHRVDTSLADIYVVHDFLTKQECDGIINAMETNLKASTVTDPNADKSVRTSSTSHLDCKIPAVEVVERKIHDFIGISLAHGEELQGQRYLVGQEFKSHTDYFDGSATYNLVHLDRGQRTWTFMVYLDDCEEGGHTRFTRLDYEVKPKMGKALIWNNQLPNGQGNHYTEHWGMPVTKGVKNVITKWMREKPAIRQIS